MDLPGLITSFEDWVWWIIAVILFALELVAPGVFFLWFGFAAIVTGVLVLVIDVSWQIQVAVFAVVSGFSLFAGRRYFANSAQTGDQPHLNRRMAGFVGRSYVLEQPIRNRRGKLKIDDAMWDVRGPDSAAGTWVKVTGVDGMSLIVEPDRPPG